MEHRWGLRYSLDMSVRLEGHPNLLAFARLRNVSSSGAYIETGAAPALDSRILLELGCRPRPGDSRCRIPAYVARRDERGIGVEWCEFAPQSVLTLIATAWQALSPARERKPAARASAWPSRSIPARSTAAHP